MGALSKEEIAVKVRSVLIPHKNGLGLASFIREYYYVSGAQIPFRTFGYQSLVDFLKTLSNYVSLFKTESDEYWLVAVANSVTDHISKLVYKQKSSNGQKKVSNSTRCKTNFFLHNTYTNRLIHPQELKMQQTRVAPIYLLRKIASVLVGSGGMSIDQFEKKYRAKFEHDINFTFYGFNSLIELLQCHSDFVDVRSSENAFMIYPKISNVLSTPVNNGSPTSHRYESFPTLDSIRSNLCHLLENRYTSGIEINKLAEIYEKEFGSQLDCRSYGCSSLYQFIYFLDSYFFKVIEFKPNKWILSFTDAESPKNLKQTVDQTKIHVINGVNADLPRNLGQIIDQTIVSHVINGIDADLPKNLDQIVDQTKTLCVNNGVDADLSKNLGQFVDQTRTRNINGYIREKFLKANHVENLNISQYVGTDNSIPVCINKIVSLSEFWVNIRDDNLMELEHLMQIMKDFYGSSSFSNMYNMEKIMRVIGMPCAVQYDMNDKDGFWHRAIIVDVNDLQEDFVKVSLLDCGYCVEVHCDKIRCLLERFSYLPAQSIRACLSDPSLSDRKHLMTELTDKFIQICRDTQWNLFARIDSFCQTNEQPIFFVSLFINVDLRPSSNISNMLLEELDLVAGINTEECTSATTVESECANPADESIILFDEDILLCQRRILKLVEEFRHSGGSLDEIIELNRRQHERMKEVSLLSLLMKDSGIDGFHDTCPSENENDSSISEVALSVVNVSWKQEYGVHVVHLNDNFRCVCSAEISSLIPNWKNQNLLYNFMKIHGLDVSPILNVSLKSHEGLLKQLVESGIKWDTFLIPHVITLYPFDCFENALKVLLPTTYKQIMKVLEEGA